MNQKRKTKLKIDILGYSKDADLSLPSEEDLCFFINKALQHQLFANISPNAILSIAFIDEETMKKINTDFRNKAESTDVLSFNIDELTPEGFLWGEIIISPNKAQLNAKKKNCSLKEELSFLIIHGLLHLKGLDHQDAKQLAQMQEYEDVLLNFTHRGEK